jgi:hypothetical protein
MEPREQAAAELFRGGANGAAVIRVVNLPENYPRVTDLNVTGVSEGDVAIDLAVDQKDRDSRRGDYIFWGDLLHVEPVFPAYIKKSKFDNRTKNSASKPRTEMKRLTHAIVCNLAKAGERRFGGHGAEVGFNHEGLQEFGGSHGFAEAEDAMRVILRKKEIEPLLDVVAFEKAVGGEFASAGAVGARVGEKNRETSREKKLRVSGHSEAVVGEAVQKNYSVAMGVTRLDCPSPQRCAVWCADGHIGEIGIEAASDVSHGSAGFRC